MNCSEIQELLSAYYDGELTDELNADISRHLSGCAECVRRLAGFQSLSNLADKLDSPVPPDQLWGRIEEQLERTPVVAIGDRPSRFVLTRRKLVSLVTVLLVLAGVVLIGVLREPPPDEHQQFTADFGQYLTEFHRNPDAAQTLLLAKYEHWETDPERIIDQVGYRPAIADRLPKNYVTSKTYVIKMPCCTCVQMLCQRMDGSKLAVFEHDDDESEEWFGKRPQINTICSGKKCCLVELEDQLAASWRHDNRYLTLIGVRDVSEVNELVQWMKVKQRE